MKDKCFYINLLFVYFYYTDGLMWFRWFGNKSGYRIKNIKKHKLLFSERRGETGKVIGNYHILKLNAYGY